MNESVLETILRFGPPGPTRNWSEYTRHFGAEHAEELIAVATDPNLLHATM